MVVFFAPFMLGESPFSAVQLLWLNVVMDTLAAFALGTEPPLPNIAEGKPHTNQQVMRPPVWRQIFGMTLWNFLVMMCVLGLGPLTMDLEYNMGDSAGAALLVSAEETASGSATKTPAELAADRRVLAKLTHCTYLFHIFVFLQLFNLINCRKDGAKDYNVFAQFWHNWYFLAVLIAEFALQLRFPESFIRTAALGQREWGACLMVGATPLLISVLLKCTPERWLEWRIFNVVDENKEMNNRLTQAFE